MEVKIGVVRAMNRDPNFSRVLENWYQERLVPAYANRTIPVDKNIAEKRAEFEKVRTIPYSDGLIAATASVHEMIIVTRNTSDFAGLGIELINPWDHPID